MPNPNLTPLEGPISPEAQSLSRIRDPDPAGGADQSGRAQSVPNPNLRPLEVPISPEAQSVPNPNLRPLEGPTPLGAQDPAPATIPEGPDTVPELIPDTEPGGAPTIRDFPLNGRPTLPGLGPQESPLTSPSASASRGRRSRFPASASLDRRSRSPASASLAPPLTSPGSLGPDLGPADDSRPVHCPGPRARSRAADDSRPAHPPGPRRATGPDHAAWRRA